jgi:type I restriction enzyme S subunit
VHNTEKKITAKGLNESSTKILKQGQVIVSARGTVGEVSQLGRDMAFNQSCYGLDGNPAFIINDFLYYLIKFHVSALKQNTHGAVFDTITRQTFDYIEVELPSLPEQNRIAKILGDLDTKIELNQQMNKTLEAMAQALFKRWFVDFEFPDAKGRPHKFSGGKMVSSELGPIPARWKIVPLTELVNVLGGGTPSTGVSSYWDGEIPFFSPKDASGTCYTTRTEKTVTQEGLTHCNSALFPQGTVFITARGTVGKVCMAGVPMAMNQSCYALKGKELRQLYVFFLIKDIAQKLIQQSHGTVFETITTQTFQRTVAIRPEAATVNSFCMKVECLYDRMLGNIIESATLETIRDTLLPRLMSGRIKIRN